LPVANINKEASNNPYGGNPESRNQIYGKPVNPRYSEQIKTDGYLAGKDKNTAMYRP